ncbi:MAG: hypothetical protein Q4G51_06730 [Dermatophilus congolensis]|nr:hypothetical protein [Dermatophilus congolensis]
MPGHPDTNHKPDETNGPPEKRPAHPGRRAVLGGAIALGVGGLAWTGSRFVDGGLGGVGERIGSGLDELFDEAREEIPRSPRPQSTPRPLSAMTYYTRFAGARLVYEVDGRPSRFAMDPSFAGQLETSLRSHWEAAGWAAPARLTSYGTWIDGAGRSPSWHHEGRAFDIGRIISGDGETLVSCRYDLWKSQTGRARAAAERAYWGLAATLHRDFSFVLTYLYDDAHHNHIHVDNGLSGAERSTFRRHRIQVGDVQAMCRHVWGEQVEITGAWDSATRSATEAVLERTGIGGRLTSGDEHWHAFLDATARHSGRQG